MSLRRTAMQPRRSRLERRAGLTARTGIVRTAGPARASRQASALGAVAPSPARTRRAALDVPADVVELLRQRSGGRCEAALPEVCTGDATDKHHRKRRRDGGHAIANLVHLCRACHRWAHLNPADARELGLVVSAWEDPAARRVAVRSRLLGRRRWVLLSPTGEYLTDADA